MLIFWEIPGVYLHAERMDFHSYLFIIVNPGMTSEKVLNNVELINT